MECLYCMPVIEMQVIKFFGCIPPPEIFYHPPAHTVTVLHNVVALGLAVMVLDTVDCLVLYPPTGKVVDFVMPGQGLSEVGCSAGESPHALGIERFPAKDGYFK
jgi:hypothetical protein